MSTYDDCLAVGVPQRSIRPLGARVLVAIGRLATAVFWDWPERARQRRQLASMDDRTLGDLGISRSEVESEFRKARWHR